MHVYKICCSCILYEIKKKHRLNKKHYDEGMYKQQSIETVKAISFNGKLSFPPLQKVDKRV